MPQPTHSDKHYARLSPLLHFFVLPVLTINVLNAIRHIWYRPMRDTAWEAVVALALLVLAAAVRAMAPSVEE